MIKIGDQLLIELKVSDGNEQFKSKVVDIEGRQLYIDYPISTKTNRTAYFIDGTELKCSFVSKDNVVYTFSTEVKGRVKRELPMILLTYPSYDELIKIQRREYVRVETEIDVAIHSLHGEFPPFVTVTNDFSAGGTAVLVPKDVIFKKDDEMKIWVVLPFQNGDYQYYSFLGRVVRVMDHDQGRNKVSIEFLNVTEQERQGLLRFSFDRQVELRKKGTFI